MSWSQEVQEAAKAAADLVLVLRGLADRESLDGILARALDGGADSLALLEQGLEPGADSAATFVKKFWLVPESDRVTLRPIFNNALGGHDESLALLNRMGEPAEDKTAAIPLGTTEAGSFEDPDEETRRVQLNACPS